jgi:7-cyano-7-deazaguanine synthase in queuosine biosynthesis
LANLTVYATPIPADAAHAHRGADAIGLLLYGAGTADLPGIGPHLEQQARRMLLGPPSVRAWDFLSLALAAFAADRFVVRDGSPDGWTRVIGLDVALRDPDPWRPLLPQLSAALRFLTGDVWHVSVRNGGKAPPAVPARLHDRDALTLFSGGLDSFPGALQLAAAGRRPFLISQGSPKEVQYQVGLAQSLGLQGYRFDGRASELWRPPYEGSTRGRSILFFAYGALAASASGIDEVWVPENALIAVNPPFTRRRVGSLSTRTTHPHFIGLINEMWKSAGLDSRLVNPFFASTKGEMMSAANGPQLSRLASASYSCGKGKRINMQCGRCIPCLIRRAAFHASGVNDNTNYFYELEENGRADDVLAARQAVARLGRYDDQQFEAWVRATGPLPDDQQIRAATVDAVRRGLAELRDLFNAVRWR